MVWAARLSPACTQPPAALIQTISEKTGIPKAKLFMGLALFLVLFVVFGYGVRAAWYVVSVVFSDAGHHYIPIVYRCAAIWWALSTPCSRPSRRSSPYQLPMTPSGSCTGSCSAASQSLSHSATKYCSGMKPACICHCVCASLRDYSRYMLLIYGVGMQAAVLLFLQVHLPGVVHAPHDASMCCTHADAVVAEYSVLTGVAM